MHAPIAVVGVSALFPGSVDKTGFWRDILAGKDLITEVPPSHWLIEDYYDPDPSVPDKTYAKRGGFLPSIDFDPVGWGVPPSTVPATDTAQLLALIVAQQVLEDASQGQFAKMDRERMSVILGVTSAQELLGSMVSRLQHPIWRKSLREAGLPEARVEEIVTRIRSHYADWQEATFPGLLGNVVAGRIANRLDLHGTNCVTDAACASTLSALSMAANELRLGQSDVVLCGGVDTMNDIFMYMCFSKTPAMSPTGDCRPFSDQADGTMLGEGLCLLALRRLEDAERDGDRIYAVIRGIGASSDGRSKSVYAPVAEGQSRALRRAFDDAGYGPDGVELVEAHGTGTKAGDAAEFDGLCEVFDASGREDRQWCAIGSVKSQIGHAKAAAGAAGLFKAIMALHHKVLPPTIKVERPNPKLELEKSPFYLNTATRPWIRDPHHPRRAGVSSFGFGGSNFHVALEEYTGPAKRAWRLRTAPSELIVLAGSDVAGLRQAIAATKSAPGSLARIARTSQESLVTGPARLAVVASDLDDLKAKLSRAEATIASKPAEAFSTPDGVHYAFGGEAGGIGFLFPGQGSQYLGMGADTAMAWDAARSAWDDAAHRKFGGESLHHVVFPRPVFDDAQRVAQDKVLTDTRLAQPALGVASLALLRLLDQVGVKADAAAGHSYGEVAALHAAGVLDTEAFLRASAERGKAMHEASAIPGAMVAVQAEIEAVRKHVAEWKLDVAVANHNAPDQVVLSGTTEGVAEAEKRFAGAGILATRLNVATAFHSPIVAPAAEPLAEHLADLRVAAPRFDVYADATASPYPSDPDAIRALLAEQLSAPVRFVEIVQAMYARGVRTFIEVGPNAVLTRLVGKILDGKAHVAVALDRKGKNGVTALHEGLGRLVVAGVKVDLAALWRDFAVEVDGPAKPKLSIPISGANYGKPYPAAPGSPFTPKGPAPRPVEEAPVATAVAKAAPAKPAAPSAATAPPVGKAAAAAVAAPPAPAASVAAPPAPTAPAAPVAAAPVSPPVAGPARNVGAVMSERPDAWSAWVAAYQETQRQTAEAHATYQQAMADSHAAFLRTVEASFSGLSAMVTGQAPAPMPMPAAPMPMPAATMPRPAALPAMMPVVAAPAPAPVAVPAPPPAVVQAAVARGIDLEALLLGVVADKTGYPTELLGLQMELEADLGIDSIKRVEILSAVREKAPQLPEVDAQQMAGLSTLGHILDHLRASGVSLEAPSPAPAAPAAVAHATGVDLEGLLLGVVAEKTGYPTELLGLQMELEADLGIDSIKRVEILSAVREKAPHLPEVDAQQMAGLSTLGHILDHLRASGIGTTVPAATVAPVAAAAPTGEGIDLEGLLLDVVAEKTGYPAELLGLQMELEADLGIDSIKRVEILSAVREKAPHLPEVDAQQMAGLTTLGHIVEHLRASGLGSGVAAPAAPAVVAPHAVGRFVPRAVASAAPGLAMHGLGDLRRLAITDDGTGVAQALAALLRGHGVPAEVVASAPADADGLVLLDGLRVVADREAARAVARGAFESVLAASPGLSQGGVLVTVQDTGGRLGTAGVDPIRAWLGGLPGLLRTAALEWQGLSAKAIDIATAGRTPTDVAAAIAAELLGGGSEREVGLGADGRVTLHNVEAEPAGAGANLGASDVIVVSGGARGVTAACAVALAEATKARLVLLGRTAPTAESDATKGIDDDAGLKKALLAAAKADGRTPSPAELGAAVKALRANREVEATLAAIRRAGSDVRYVAADVTDAAAIAAGLADVRGAWGPITGIVHGAGVLADKALADKTVEHLDKVLSPKLGGLAALLDATASDPLKLLVLFSSVAGRTGNVGQADYALANRTLDTIAAAERERRPGCRVASIAWGPWEGGMVTKELAAHFGKMGVALIPLAEGARRLVAEALGGSPDVAAIVGGAPGEGPLGAEADHAVIADVLVGPASHPWLADHTIAAIPVVPVVLALEWFARAASAVRPDLGLAAIRDLKVLRGIQLKGWSTGGDRFVVTARKVSNGDGAVIALELLGADGKAHYTATADLSGRAPVAGDAPSVAGLGPWEGVVYDGHTLFHGPKLQAIRGLDGVSDKGLSGTLVGGAGLGWSGDGWQTDPALLDGALQLAVLYARHVLGGATLPTRIDAFRTYGKGLVTGPIAGRVVVREKHAARVVTDVVLLAGNTVIAELRGVETHLRPGEPTKRSTVQPEA